MRILLLARSFPPDSRIAAKRWGEIAESLSKLDAQVIVFTESKPRLQRPSHPRSKNIQVISAEGTEGASEFPNKNNNNLGNKILVLLKSRANRWKPVVLDSSIKRWIKYGWIYRDKLKDAVKDSDIIISTYGPSGPLFLGWYLSRKYSLPWVVDLRDAFESRDHSIEFFRFLGRRLERYLLKKANLRITIGKKLAEYLSKRYELKFLEIYNGWSEKDKLLASNSENSLYLYYAGTVYDHRLAALRLLLTSMKRFSDVHLKVRLVNFDSQKKIESLLIEDGTIDKVQILGPVGPEIVSRELNNALGAVVLEDLDPKYGWATGTVTGKLFSLLVSGKPGIAVVSKNSEITEVVALNENWVAAEKNSEIECFLQELIERPNDFLNYSKALDMFSVDSQSKKMYGSFQEII